MDERLAVLRSVLPHGGAEEAVITPLGGGITNHNYRVDMGGESFVLRIGGEGTALLEVDRAIEYACSQAAWEAGIGAEVLGFAPEHNALLTRFVPGRVLEPTDFADPVVVGRVTEAIKRFHEAPEVPGSFSPFEVVRTYHERALKHGVSFPAEMDRARALLDEIEEQLSGEDTPRPCHNDLLPSNLLNDGEWVRIIDWEYAGMGDQFFDLGNLAANNEFDEAGELALLKSYFGAVDPAHLRRLRLMRLASDMRESLWGYLQSGISTLDFDFVSYGRERLDRFLERVQGAELRPASATL